MITNAFYFILKDKIFLFSLYLKFCPDIFSHEGKVLDKTAKINFKIYDVTNWETKITMYVFT